MTLPETDKTTDASAVELDETETDAVAGGAAFMKLGDVKAQETPETTSKVYPKIERGVFKF